METTTTIEAFRRVLDARRREGRVGLVPTMGALHDGHLSLVREAKARAGFAAATIFVNPTQFGPNEDLAKYPRDLAGDAAKLAAAGCDVLFAPGVAEMYPDGETTRVRVGKLSDGLCGPFRPVHFEGVATVVSKLFAIAGPSIALFGKKDYQQLQVIRRLATDLRFPVEVVGMPTVREKDGLAMSSRNAYLSAEERDRALGLARGLRASGALFAGGERRAGTLREACLREVTAVTSSIDYVTVADPDDLAERTGDEAVGERALVAIACRMGTTRLIDNTVLGEDRLP